MLRVKIGNQIKKFIISDFKVLRELKNKYGSNIDTNIINLDDYNIIKKPNIDNPVHKLIIYNYLGAKTSTYYDLINLKYYDKYKKYGLDDIADISQYIKLIPDEECIKHFAEVGNLLGLKVVYNHERASNTINFEDAFLISIINKRYDCMNWILKKGYKITSKIMRKVLKMSKLEILKWCIETHTYTSTIEDTYFAAQHTSKECLEYLLNHKAVYDSEILEFACRGDKLENLKYLLKFLDEELNEELLIISMDNNSLKCIKYIVEKLKYKIDLLNYAVENCSLDVFKLLIKIIPEIKSTWSPEYYEVLFDNDKYDFFEYCLNNNFLITPMTYENIIINSHNNSNAFIRLLNKKYPDYDKSS